MSGLPDASILELYPDEINKLRLIIASVNRKYMGQYDTMANISAIMSEISGRCRDELNLEVVVDMTNLDLMGDGRTTYTSPQVVPIRRLVPEAFDFARARYETQQGFVDGQPGVITEDGRWVEPTKPVAMGGAGVDLAGD